VTLSGNEVVALATSAARGGGAPPGQAAEFGRATLCHLSAGRGPDDLIHALNALPDGPVLEVPLAMARIMDDAKDDVAAGVMALAAPADLVDSYLDAQPFHVARAPGPDGLAVTFSLQAPARLALAGRIALPDGLTGLMRDLSAKVLVPDTDASRARGAGAGLTDND
jgi:hypothetical protein